MDIYQLIAAPDIGGTDLKNNARGDLLTVVGSEETIQRILRRLLTNPGDYEWHPTYGAGLLRYIGQPLSDALYDQMTADTRSQMYQESAVSQNPPPQITFIADVFSLYCKIAYTDAVTNQQNFIEFTLTK
jgi:hypothetical protein